MAIVKPYVESCSMVSLINDGPPVLLFNMNDASTIDKNWVTLCFCLAFLLGPLLLGPQQTPESLILSSFNKV